MSLSFYTTGFYTTIEQTKPRQSLLYFIFGVDSIYFILFPKVTSLLTKKKIKAKICVHLSKGKKANLKVSKELDCSKRERWGHLFNRNIEHSNGLPFLRIVYLILHFSYAWLQP